jgi:hypothetical protein
MPRGWVQWKSRFCRVAPVAQLDRASGYEPEGRMFESCRAHHSPLERFILRYLAPRLLTSRAMETTCHISERLKGCCDTCGEWPGKLHMPEELHGWYCADCCPACHPELLRPPRLSQFESAQRAA